ncbi:MAG TPA: proprotein convertase P-domain-containing protein, partial [Saprospiraceae bacterium]|nr:proprotein convertase P-domain-containing protein [Saprospiraceae bacterium]
MKLNITPLLLFIIIILACIVPLSNIEAQVYPLTNGTINTCSGKLTDSGGELLGYKANEKIINTICSDNIANSLIKLSFYSSDIKTGDELCIFDGTDITAPLLTCSTDHNNFPFAVQATTTNASGCLTLQFKSNNFIQGTGWEADISCLPTCQKINAVIDITSQTGVINNGYLDICPGEAIELQANVSFPENNTNYNQDENQCKYNWVVNNSMIFTDKNISLPKLKSGGYNVHLLVTDANGCSNSNVALQKIRVAPAPSFNINAYDSVLCLNNTLKLNATINNDLSYDVSTNAGKGFFPTTDLLADTFALPDGTGKSYTSTIYIDRFNTNEVIDDLTDLESICLNIEHSFLKDLEIKVTCPNGQSITLQNQEPSSGSVFLGIPFENDELLPEPIPGIGWNYCWSMNSTQGNWNDYLLKNNVPTLPSGSYNPYNSFANLISCPFDGPWTISITDLWKTDNGYVFDWGVNFDPQLYPPVDSFTNTIVNGNWLNNPSVSNNNLGSLSSGSAKPGKVENIWQVQDQSGCKFETVLPITFLPAQDPKCLSCSNLFDDLKDTVVCSGQLINVSVIPNTNLTKSVDFAFYTSSDYIKSNVAVLEIPVSAIQPFTLANPTNDISSVCISLKADDLNQLDFKLISPDKKLIQLIKTGDVTGKTLAKTCFLPLALGTISSGIEPYSGDYKTTDLWTNLLNASSSGKWKLQINKPYNQQLLIDSVNLKFNILQTLSYSWKSNLALSCPLCQNFNIPVTKPSYFALIVKDLYGCQKTDTSWANIQIAYPAPIVTCQVLDNGMIQFSWNKINGAISYEVSINGMPWEQSSGFLSHLVTELKLGEVVKIEVRVSQVGIDCVNEIGTVTCSYSECNLSAQAVITTVSCVGKKDGSIKINVFSGKPPYLYSFNGGQFNTTFIFNNLAQGNYTIIVSDIKLCKDTLKLIVGPPAPISANLTIDSVSCYGLKDGQVISKTAGGFSPYTYSWSSTPGNYTNKNTGLGFGNYQLTITDNKSCTTVQSFIIPQPADIKASFIAAEVSCAGMSNAYINSTISGGTYPYYLFWNTGSSAANLMNIKAGKYTLAIEDGHGCKSSNSVDITEPLPLQFTSDFTDPSCFGMNDGTCKVIVSGGTSPYKYLWNDKNKSTTSSIAKIGQGNYKVVITDANGCTMIQTFILQEPPVLKLTLTTTDEKCPGTNDGSANCKLISGNGPFNFNWSQSSIGNINTATGLNPGNYSVTITNSNGCSIEQDFNINNALPFAADITTEPVACPNSMNGQASAIILNGVAPYNYSWSDPANQTNSSATALNVGSYNVTITDARNCKLILPFAIQAINPVDIVSYKVKDQTCNNIYDGQIDIQIIGGILPYDINWSGGLPKNQPNVTLLTAGSYQVTVTDAAGCYVQRQYNLSAPPEIKIDFLAKAVTCLNANDGSLEAQVTGGNSPYSYFWSNGLINNTVDKNLAGGSYSLTIVDGSYCYQIANVLVDFPTKVLDYNLTQSYKACYNTGLNEASAVITSSTGTNYTYEWSNGINDLSKINSLSPGKYDLTLTDQYGCKLVKSIAITEWEPIIINYSVTPASCDISKDAIITLNSIKGGAANGELSKYKIEIDGIPAGLIINQLEGGKSYVINITDDLGCTLQQTIDIPKTESISFNFIASSPVCYKGNSGNIKITDISGGNAPYSYQWQTGYFTPDIINLTSGTYYCTITDSKGCSK